MMDAMEEIYKLLQKHDFQFTTDSRALQKGQAFFALRGENFDGNNFVEEALSKGAPFVVSNRKELSDQYANVFFVEDTVLLLAKLANVHRDQFSIPVIAITGSNGKTTTKEMIRDVLAKKYSVVATEGNLNNHLGVPFTILSINKDTEIAVVEMGANHIGEIASLCKIAKPTHGIITNIGKAHIGEFGGIEAIKQAKGELYDFVKERSGVVFADCRDATLQELLTQKDISPQCYVEDAPLSPELFGDYNLQNARSAYSVGLFFGVDVDDIQSALTNFRPAKNRSNMLTTARGNLVVADMYNANPTSMESAIRAFCALDAHGKEKRIILGDMRELGEYAEDEHQKMIDLVHSLGFEDVCLVGPEFSSSSYGGFKSFASVDLLIDWLREQTPSNPGVYLLKGSNGIGLSKVLESGVL